MFQAEKETMHIIQWIQDYFREQGDNVIAVIGISGGKDSSIAAALLKEALGKDRVIGVLMPNGEQPDIDDAKRLVDALGIPSVIANIGEVVKSEEALLSRVLDEEELPYAVRTNVPPRIRMANLYGVAAKFNGRVINTCNRSEDYVGYSTKHGDSAGDVAILSEYLVCEVLAIGRVLASKGILPLDLVEKTPSDGLCGKTDEDNFGFTYEMLDRHILTGTCGDPDVDARIQRMHGAGLHKVTPMPACPKGSKE